MTDEQLLSETQVAIDDEKNATARVVRLFAEIQSRKLYLRFGYPSLFEMAVKKYGYSSSCAGVRIAAMKLIVKCPEIEQKIQSGQICLTVAASIQSFTHREKTVDVAQLVEFCVGKSSREIEREFARISPEFEKREHVRQTTEDRVRVSYGSSNVLEEKLEKIKMAWSHKNHNPTREELLEMMADYILKDLEPKPPRESRLLRRSKLSRDSEPPLESKPPRDPKKTSSAKSGHIANKSDESAPLPTPGVGSEIGVDSEIGLDFVAGFSSSQASEAGSKPDGRGRYIPRRIKDAVMTRNRGKGCEFMGGDGHRCGSQYQLQFDHIKPYSHGGENTDENLRMFCAQHNRARS